MDLNPSKPSAEGKRREHKEQSAGAGGREAISHTAKQRKEPGTVREAAPRPVVL